MKAKADIPVLGVEEASYPIGKKLLQFILLLVTAVGITYYTPEPVAILFNLILLVAYVRSDDEAFWLAYFITVSTGFMGFLGPFVAVITMIPGLPGVEIAQFYIILTLFKALRKGASYRPFYMAFLQVLLVYIIFLVVQGFAIGFPPGLNRKFSLIKEIMPLALLYSIPVLFDKLDKYRNLFKLLFVIVFTALFSQLFTIIMGGVTPSQFLGATEHKHLFFDVTQGMTYRGFFSPEIVLITMLGAMVFLAMAKEKNNLILYLVLLSNFAIAFLSATRGYVLSFFIMLLLFVTMVLKFQPKRLVPLMLTGVLLFAVSNSMPIVKMQIQNALDRMTTMEALLEGDVTAGGTLNRISKRGPRVMKLWEESKLTGFGFSELYREHSDIHVANQNILLHGGILGALLLFGFFLYFNARLWLRRGQLHKDNPMRNVLPVCIIFFLGWFMIHSSSSQQFGFAYHPVTGMQLGIFFGLGSLLYHKSAELEEKQPGHSAQTVTARRMRFGLIGQAQKT